MVLKGRSASRHRSMSAGEATSASRAHPAQGRRKLPLRPANPRKPTGGKPCSSGKSPGIPAHPGTTKTGLSRRRSRVRVPSLPSFEVPANGHSTLSDQAWHHAPWPKHGPLSLSKRPAKCPIWRRACHRSHKQSRSLGAGQARSPGEHLCPPSVSKVACAHAHGSRRRAGLPRLDRCDNAGAAARRLTSSTAARADASKRWKHVSSSGKNVVRT
jgi:hypothetical protein